MSGAKGREREREREKDKQLWEGAERAKGK